MKQAKEDLAGFFRSRGDYCHTGSFWNWLLTHRCWEAFCCGCSGFKDRLILLIRFSCLRFVQSEIGRNQ